MDPEVSPPTPRVVVLGGINSDTFLRVQALPAPGETLLSSGMMRALGGKAANQAIAVARTDVAVSLLGAVGEDRQGERLQAVLVRAGVDVTGIVRLENTHTGRATVLVDDAGQNTIIVTPAANGLLSSDHVANFRSVIQAASVLVVQGEIAAATTTAAVILAERGGVRSIINLAPFGDLGVAVSIADPLVVNEIEASQLLGLPVEGAGSASVVAGLARLARSAVVTLGAEGALVVDAAGVTHVRAPVAPRVVDTTGAGDAFVGVLAAGIASGLDLLEAVAWAVEAATASVGLLGAGEKYPKFDLGIGQPRNSAAVVISG